MNAPSRIAVFGAGQVYRRLYAPAFGLHPELAVFAVADPVSRADYTRPEDLLAAVELDGVVVLSPVGMHSEHVRLALGHSLRVLVEKPPALSVAEVDGWPRPELLTAAFSRRYWPAYGKPVGPGHRLEFRLRTNPASWGARAIEPVERDLLPHAADLATWLTGEAVMGVEGVARSERRAAGTFVMSKGGRFEWEVVHGTEYVESLRLDGELLPSPGHGPVPEALRRLRRRPTEAVAAVSALLSDWATSFGSIAPAALPGIEAARSCARVIEAVEGVPSSGPS